LVSTAMQRTNPSTRLKEIPFGYIDYHINIHVPAIVNINDSYCEVIFK